MPLVIPGIQNKAGDDIEAWNNKLMGKKLGDDHNDITFAKKDLPETHRVLKPDSLATMDHRPERLNIRVNDEGTVEKVHYG